MSQTLTLYVTPVVYIYMESIQEWLEGRRAERSSRKTIAQPAPSPDRDDELVAAGRG